MIRHLVSKSLRLVLGGAFVLFGAIKFIRPEVHEIYFTIFPDVMMPLTGVAEALLGILLLIGFRTRWAAYGLALIMGGALYSHVLIGLDTRVVPVIVLGAISLIVGSSASKESPVKLWGSTLPDHRSGIKRASGTRGA